MAFSVGILIFIILPPIIVLIAFPTRLFRWLQNRFSSRLNLAIHTFVNTFQGCYKDGLNGTRDYRALSGGILAMIVGMLVVSQIFLNLFKIGDKQPVITLQITIMILIMFLVMMTVLKPYKSDIANHTGVTIYALLAAAVSLYMLLLDSSIKQTTFIIFMVMAMLTLPHCVFYGYIVYKIWTKVKIKVVIGTCREYCRPGARDKEEKRLIEHT